MFRIGRRRPEGVKSSAGLSGDMLRLSVGIRFCIHSMVNEGMAAFEPDKARS
jgi:hypothetical protein